MPEILTMDEIGDAPLRSFSAASRIGQHLREWYEGDAPAIGFRLGEKGDAERDGSDAQLRDALCLLAGMTREKVPTMDENGKQVLSEKRGKPQFHEVPFTTAERVAAMQILGVEERERWRKGDSRGVAIVRHDGTPTLSENENEENE